MIMFSDNIVEVLIIRKDAILISQFFWHEVLKTNQDYKLNVKNNKTKSQESLEINIFRWTILKTKIIYLQDYSH